MRNGLVNIESGMVTAIRYSDFITDKQLLVVFNPLYVPKYTERVELMWHGTAEKNFEDGFHKVGYVYEIENFYDCNENCHDIRITLDRISNVE